MARFWRSKLVEELLARGEGDLSRPEELSRDFGLHKNGYRLSEVQAQQILDLRLQRLTALEQDKIVAEYKETMEKITDLIDVLAKPARVTTIISQELAEVKKQYGDERKTEIVTTTQELSTEDLIARRGRGRDDFPRRLHEIAAGRRLPGAEARRTRQAGDHHQGRRFRREAVHRQHARLYPVLLQSRARLLAQGLRGAAGQPRPRVASRS